MQNIKLVYLEQPLTDEERFSLIDKYAFTIGDAQATVLFEHNQATITCICNVYKFNFHASDWVKTLMTEFNSVILLPDLYTIRITNVDEMVIFKLIYA